MTQVLTETSVVRMMIGQNLYGSQYFAMVR
jgi:hypothetical protein